MGDETTIRDVARLQAQMEAMRDDVKELKTSVESLLEFTQQARGSWKTVMAISGFAAAIGALFAKIVPHIPFR